MNMAKANTTDLDLAQNIARIIEDLERGFMPNPDDSADIVWFDIDDHNDCKHVINAILNEAKRGSLFRVTFGMLVLCDPQNTLLHPDSDILEPHPLIAEMESDIARETQAARYWNKRYHELAEECAQLHSIVSACADAAGAQCSNSESLEFMGDVPKEVYLAVEKYRRKYQREHIETNRWKNRAELAERVLDALKKQKPLGYSSMTSFNSFKSGETQGLFVHKEQSGDKFLRVYAAPVPAQGDYEFIIPLIHFARQVRKPGISDEQDRLIASMHAEIEKVQEHMRNNHVPAKPAQQSHPDDFAVDRFADCMKKKLSKCRDKGRGGWDNPALCKVDDLAKMLIAHIPKGDPVDVANFAMMLFHRDGGSEALKSAAQKSPAVAVPDDWDAVGGDYDKSIHSNPSADAWADFFIKTFPRLQHKRDIIHAWFANAMMAMRDSVESNRATGWKLVPVEPTTAMLKLGSSAEGYIHGSYENVVNIGLTAAANFWSKMLSASPEFSRSPRITEQDLMEIGVSLMDFIIHTRDHTIDADKIPSDWAASEEARALLEKLNVGKGEE